MTVVRLGPEISSDKENMHLITLLQIRRVSRYTVSLNIYSISFVCAFPRDIKAFKCKGKDVYKYVTRKRDQLVVFEVEKDGIFTLFGKNLGRLWPLEIAEGCLPPRTAILPLF